MSLPWSQANLNLLPFPSALAFVLVMCLVLPLSTSHCYPQGTSLLLPPSPPPGAPCPPAASGGELESREGQERSFTEHLAQVFGEHGARTELLDFYLLSFRPVKSPSPGLPGGARLH